MILTQLMWEILVVYIVIGFLFTMAMLIRDCRYLYEWYLQDGWLLFALSVLFAFVFWWAAAACEVFSFFAHRRMISESRKGLQSGPHTRS